MRTTVEYTQEAYDNAFALENAWKELATTVHILFTEMPEAIKHNTVQLILKGYAEKVMRYWDQVDIDTKSGDIKVLEEA